MKILAIKKINHSRKVKIKFPPLGLQNLGRRRLIRLTRRGKTICLNKFKIKEGIKQAN